MSNFNIPIYRAKKIDSDDYVKGYLIELEEMFYISCPQNIESNTAEESRSVYLNDDGLYIDKDYFVAIDQTTLSIHFPDAQVKDLFFGIDNGKGASIIEALFIEDNTPFKGVAKHTHYGYVFYDKNDDWVHISKLKDIKVIGIQK